MTCTTCGLQLQAGTTICPRCGTPTPYAQTPYQYASPPQQDQMPYAAPAPPYNMPPTNYNQYGPPVQGYDPYTNPYPPVSAGQPGQNMAPYPYAPPAVPPRRKKNTGIVVGVVLALVVLIGVAFFAFLRAGNPAVAPSPTPGTTPTTTVIQNPYPPNTGTLILSDPLKDNSKGYKWDEAIMNGTAANDVSHCTFSGGAYHVERTVSGLLSCNPEATQLMLSNLTFEATFTIIKGDYAGFVLRMDQAKGVGYLVLVGQKGDYAIDTVNFQDAKTPYKILKSGSNSAIKTGLGVANVVAVVANGNTIGLYVNNQYIDSATDSTYTQGQIGVCGYGNNAAFDVSIINAHLWKQ